MRSRKRKNGEARMEACGDLILPFDKENITPVSLTELFPDKKSFRIEIGCGKGAFISGIAERNPEVGFIAVEKIGDVMIVATEKIKNSISASSARKHVFFKNGISRFAKFCRIALSRENGKS